jgi:serine acetyltransferase
MATAQPTLERHRKTDAWWRLLWSDYTAHYSYKQESGVRRCLLAAPRIASNGSLHACLLVRLTLAGPTASRWLFRRVLLLTHGCDFAPTAQIGAGLQLNHPIGITVGPRVSLGTEVVLFHGVTLLAGDSGVLRVEDGVEIFTGACVIGSLTVGARAVVGANVRLAENLPPDARFTFSRFASLAS